MKKVTMALAAALAGGMLAAGPLLAPDALAQDIKIGYVTTLSGPQASIGDDMRDAVNLALDHLGHKMAGKTVKVIFADDTFKPAIGKQKTEQLIESDKVNFLAGYIWSNVLLASVKPAEDSKTFIISSNAGPSQIAGEMCSPWFFAASWQNDQTPMAMGEYMNSQHVKSLFIVAPNYAAGKDMAEGAKRTFKGKVVDQEMTQWPQQLDFSAELSKIRAAKPDGVFIFYPGAHGTQFLTQYSQAGLRGKIPLYTSFTIDALNVNQLKDLAVGVPSSQSWVPDLPYAANKTFVTDFKKKYHRVPSFYAAQAYDTINLIDSAVVAVKGDVNNKDAVRAALEKANFKSVRGPFRFGNNHFPIQNFYIKEAVKEADGSYSFKTIATAMKDAQDVYHTKCPMK